MIPLAVLRAAAPYTIGAAALGGAVWAVHSYGASRYAAGVADDKARSDAVISQMVAQAETARAQEDAKQRAEDARRAAAQQEIVDAATAEALRLRDARDRAAAAEQRLRGRFAALAASCSGGAGADPSAAGASAPAEGAAGVPADLPGWLVAIGRRYAEIADERGLAGATCERAYDALTPIKSRLPDVPPSVP